MLQLELISEQNLFQSNVFLLVFPSNIYFNLIKKKKIKKELRKNNCQWGESRSNNNNKKCTNKIQINYRPVHLK